jgi:PKD repeat protein
MRGLLISILVFAIQSLAWANQPPVAVAIVDVNSGPAPLTVCVDVSQSYDPDGDPIWIVEWWGGTLAWPGSPGWPLLCYTFNEVGTFETTLWVYTADGLYGTDVVTITVERPIVPPVPVAFVSSRPSPLTVCFDGSRSHDYGGPLTYTWDFGDGSPESNEIAPCHTYESDGWYTVVLTVQNELNLSASATLTINAMTDSPPVADAGPDQNMYTGDTVYLYGSATSPDGVAIIIWGWTVVDVPPGSMWELWFADRPTAYFLPLSPGDYVLALRVIDEKGNGSAPDYVTVHAHDNLPPVAIATADKTTVTVGEEVCFDGSQSYDPEAGPLTYMWDFDDGSPFGVGVATCHTFSSSGTFDVTLSVIDERNAFDSNVVTIEVLPPHIQAFGQVVWCDGSAPVGGQLNATDQNGHPLTFALAMPPENGTADIEPNGAFLYTPNETWDGSDSFGFTATDGNYISNMAFVNLYVFNRPPEANAGPDQNVYTGDIVFLNGTATSPDGAEIIIWGWTVVDVPPGSIWELSFADCPNAQFLPLSPGDYVLTLRVTDANGNGSAPDYVIVHVHDNLPPESIPTATPSFGSAPLTVEFTANAFDPNNDPLTYVWDFGDASSKNNHSTLENPTHIYDYNGFYHVALDVCDGLATISRSITIRAGRYGIDYLLGDIDFDGDVDFADVNEFTSAYLSENGDPDYNSDADLNPNDGFIDLYDFALLANDWGKTLP